MLNSDFVNRDSTGPRKDVKIYSNYQLLAVVLLNTLPHSLLPQVHAGVAGCLEKPIIWETWEQVLDLLPHILVLALFTFLCSHKRHFTHLNALFVIPQACKRALNQIE